MIDLHIHTTASADGQYGPEKIINMAFTIGITALAFADHNTVKNVKAGRSLCREAKIDFIEAIEFNSDFNGKDIHLLGYGVNPDDPRFLEWLDEIKEGQIRKCKEWARNLRELGVNIRYDEAALITPGRLPTGSNFLNAIARRKENLAHPLIAPYLPGGDKYENGYVDFYFDVLAQGPARSTITFQTTQQVIARLKELGALPVLAHPVEISRNALEIFIDAGLGGIEAASSYHDKKITADFIDLAREYDLIITAGSDFHGPKFKKNVLLGGITPNDRGIFHKLLAALGR